MCGAFGTACPYCSAGRKGKDQARGGEMKEEEGRRADRIRVSMHWKEDQGYTARLGERRQQILASAGKCRRQVNAASKAHVYV